MKKISLFLAGAIAAAAFAPEASAVPVFARQTGLACSSCHFQHFPLLNGTGQEFKASAFTQLSAKGKFKTDELSIPDVVNMGVFTTTYFQTQDAGKTGGVSNAVAVDKWGVPGTGGELSLFFGGRVSNFAGFLAEAGLGGGGAANTGGVVGAGKLAMLFPVGDARVGPVIFSSNGQGAAYSFELLNTGAANTHKMMGNSGPDSQHVRAAYASQYLRTNSAATGIAMVANNDMGFINLAAYEMAGNSSVGGANNLNLTYIRVASTIDVAGWETGFGIQNFGGKSSVSGALLTPAAQYNAPKATVIDAQMQGEVGDKPLGVYVSYGVAPAGSATEANPFNPMGSIGGNKASSLNVAAEYGIIPHVSTIQVAMRMAKNGAATNDADNALLLGVTYELVQNIALSLTHTQQSGSAWKDVAGTVPVGKTATTLLLEALF